MGDKRAIPTPVKRVGRWIRSRSVREQVTMSVVAALILLVILKFSVKGQNNMFIFTQIAHSAGILVLTYKLSVTKTCSGLSLKTQELTAIYLIMRIVAYFGFLRDLHVVLDSITLICTLWVIYMVRFKLKDTYMQELDNMPLYYVLVPCAIVAVIGHPGYQLHIFTRFFCVSYGN